MSSVIWSSCLVLQDVGITGMYPHLCLCGTGDWSPDFIHARKALWKQSCILSLNYSVFLEDFRGDCYINDLCLRKTVLHSTCCYIWILNSGPKVADVGILSLMWTLWSFRDPMCRNTSSSLYFPLLPHRGPEGSRLNLWVSK